MKISLNWIKEYTKVDLSIDQLIEKIGAQLGAVDEVVDLGSKYKGIVVAEVVSCDKHGDADKLSVCKINDGQVIKSVERDSDGLVQVVCGAPNVKAGMLAAWLPPGVTVPSSIDKEPFVLEAREIRGVMSNGMLASAAELGISDDHNGIIEIDQKASVGDDFAEIYALNDYVIDIENKMFTHRPDLFGVLGVAREIAGIQNIPFSSPPIYKNPTTTGEVEKGGLPLEVDVELPDLVPRFIAVTFENVVIGPSPAWMQTVLARLGIRPINNVVDITNYFMILTGQPLHAYDYDKVKALSSDVPTLQVRYPKEGESLILLNGKTVVPHKEAIVIATDKQPVGIGGVMGGKDTEVDEATKNIILECATFDMYSVRKTAMMHGLFTDAVTRFTKGQSPFQNDRVVAWASEALVHDTGGKKGGKINDVHGNLPEPAQVSVSAEFINTRLGLKLSAQEIGGLLTNVEFDVDISGDDLTVIPPFWRMDIEIPEDIVEEVGRLYGFDKLPVELPNRTIKPAERNKLIDFKSRLRNILSANGATEVLTYNFVHGDLLTRVDQDPGKAYELSNALSPDLQYFRMSLIPSLLEKIHPNIKAGNDVVNIYELNKVHSKDHVSEGIPSEFNSLGFVTSANDKLEQAGAVYYQARLHLDALADRLGITLKFVPIDETAPNFPSMQPFDPKRSAIIQESSKGILLGVVGEFKQSVVRQLKLPRYSAGFEVDVEELMRVMPTSSRYKALMKFPKVAQDMTLKVPAEKSYQEIELLIYKSLDELGSKNMSFDVAFIGTYHKPQDKSKNMTFSFKIGSSDRTLTASEVNAILDQVSADAKNKFGAERV